VGFTGGMAEWSKAAVLKTVDRKVRGFESYSLRRQRHSKRPYGESVKGRGRAQLLDTLLLCAVMAPRGRLDIGKDLKGKRAKWRTENREQTVMGGGRGCWQRKAMSMPTGMLHCFVSSWSLRGA
jgi:hypothetical protein